MQPPIASLLMRQDSARMLPHICGARLFASNGEADGWERIYVKPADAGADTIIRMHREVMADGWE